MRAMWDALEKSRFEQFANGLPTTLYPLPDSDLSEALTRVSHGIYINGGVTISQARHFVNGLYAVGMCSEGDRILESICESMAGGFSFGGVLSGVDWQTWDGLPSGYEGLLSDQLGIFEPILSRWASIASIPDLLKR